MNTYETLILFSEDTSEADQKKFIDTIKDLVEKNNGNLKETENWGKKTLAFQIDSSKTGFYWLLNIEASETLPKKLSDFLRIDDSILRFLVNKAVVSKKPKKVSKKVTAPKKKLTETFIR